MANTFLVPQQYAENFALLLSNELAKPGTFVRVKRPPRFELKKTLPRSNFDRFKTSTREGIVFVVCVAAVVGLLLL